ncbi:MAG: 3'-5' exonuclease, partial [Candidatus Accumulibacter sp.]|nr:3'-5' exonuclease [Accumulibacter sp.]
MTVNARVFDVLAQTTPVIPAKAGIQGSEDRGQRTEDSSVTGREAPANRLSSVLCLLSSDYREPLVFVDLETTGTNFAKDRIIEIGLVEVDRDGVREWSALVDPERPVPPFITGLTGIDTAMVETAPAFAQLAPELLEKLRGR